LTAAPTEVLRPGDIEHIERATAAAVSPQALEELDGWLLAFDSGTVNRAKSAVPLRHAPGDARLLGAIEARYAAHGLPPLFRLAADPCFDGFRRELVQRGYREDRPTRVQLASTHTVRAVSTQAPAAISASPDPAWAALFLGEGFDPVDGANRVAALSRAPDALYASVVEGGQTVAAGAAVFSHGWAGVHGMRTDAACRGRGLAGRILAGLAEAALERGLPRIFLQVEAGNAAAQGLYRRAGFETAWSYAYWGKP